jgi:4-diphosphocytidyl-2-C-methyl-D-erythritol kinase
VRWRRAPAKINLFLRVIGRRADNWHEIESLVAFGGICDWLGFEPGPDLALEVQGPSAREAGPVDDNLVLRAARALAAHVPGLKVGRFQLIKRLPAAAGLGGGSSDAAAALRSLAEWNGFSVDDERLRDAAFETGADVPVCLHPRARMMTGVGEKLGPCISLPRVFAVLVNPRVSAPTRQVFAALGLAPGFPRPPCALPSQALFSSSQPLIESLRGYPNDLEAGALRIAPAVGPVLERLSQAPEAKLTRMSGSGATCFALFEDRRGAAKVRREIAAEKPEWWVEATGLC